MWNTLAITLVCVCVSGSHLIGTKFETDEEVCPTSKKTVQGVWEVWLANEAAAWKETGGLTEVCQLHNEAPPCS